MSEPEKMSGQILGYRIEYLNEDGLWKELNFDRRPDGVPYPRFDRAWLYPSNLFGYEQAMTLFWGKLAESAASSGLGIRKLRLVPYKVTYSLEWEKDESQAIEPVDTIEDFQKLNTLKEAMGLKP